MNPLDYLHLIEGKKLYIDLSNNKIPNHLLLAQTPTPNTIPIPMDEFISLLRKAIISNTEQTTTKPTIKQLILNSLSNINTPPTIADSFISHLLSHFQLPHSLNNYLNISMIQSWLPAEEISRGVTIVKLLCKKPTKLFSKHFVMFDKGFDIIFTNREIKMAKKKGVLIHPRTGRGVKNFQKRVYVVWKGTKLLREMLREESK